MQSEIPKLLPLFSKKLAFGTEIQEKAPAGGVFPALFPVRLSGAIFLDFSFVAYRFVLKFGYFKLYYTVRS